MEAEHFDKPRVEAHRPPSNAAVITSELAAVVRDAAKSEAPRADVATMAVEGREMRTAIEDVRDAYREAIDEQSTELTSPGLSNEHALSQLAPAA
jgi:hypothetical protein